jgi:hypothetical protein
MGISENQIILVVVLTAIIIVAGSLIKLYLRKRAK